MAKIIDLCLDLPSSKEDFVQTLSMYCLGDGKTKYAGYKKTFGVKLANQIGYTMDELDEIAETRGEGAFNEIVGEAAQNKLMTIDQFVQHLDNIGVEWGITNTANLNNEDTANICSKYPNKFKGFAYIDPKNGMDAVRELEYCIKNLHLSALYITAFRTGLPANDKKNYPLYAKACELKIPVFIYSSMNLSTGVPMDIGHPRYIDEVARDFPEMRIMAAVGGWPWVMDLVGLALRHKNVYINMEVHQPSSIIQFGSGFEPLQYWVENRIQDKFCFASMWNVQGIPLKELIDQVDELPFSDETKEKILYKNAERFFQEI